MENRLLARHRVTLSCGLLAGFRCVLHVEILLGVGHFRNADDPTELGATLAGDRFTTFGYQGSRYVRDRTSFQDFVLYIDPGFGVFDGLDEVFVDVDAVGVQQARTFPVELRWLTPI